VTFAAFVLFRTIVVVLRGIDDAPVAGGRLLRRRHSRADKITSRIRGQRRIADRLPRPSSRGSRFGMVQ
jgi:hypothetical protein